MTTITKAQLKEIHDIACSTWKKKIEGYAGRNPFGGTVEFSQEEIDAMFDAATSEQKPVLEKIFGQKQFMLLDMKHGQIAEIEDWFVIRLNNYFIFLNNDSDTLTLADHVIFKDRVSNLPCTLLTNDYVLDFSSLQY